MLLDTITKSLEIVLGAAVAANQLPLVAVYSDQTPTTFTPASNDGQSNGVTAVTLVPAPAASTQRRIHSLSIWNADTQSVTVTVRLNNNSTMRIIIKVALAVGDSLTYEAQSGWIVRDAMGNQKVGGTTVRAPALIKSGWLDTANITTVTAMTTGVCQVLYCEVAPFASSSVNLLLNVTTAVATITWAEVAIYKGTPRLNNTVLDLTRLGWADVAAIVNSTGLKNILISLTTPLQAGDNIYVVIGTAATTVMQVRGGLADNLQSGFVHTLTARPSTTPGPIATVLAANSLVPAVLFIYLN